MIRSVATVVVSVALLASCSSSDGGSDASADPAPTTTSETVATAEAPPTPSPEPSVNGLGFEVDLTVVKASVLEYKTNVPPEATAEQGTRWDGVKVSLCNVSLDAETSPLVFNWRSWQLDDSEGGRFDPSNIQYRQFPAPDFAQDEAIPVGECSKGWVVFDVPVETSINQVNLVVGDERQSSWTVAE